VHARIAFDDVLALDVGAVKFATNDIANSG